MLQSTYQHDYVPPQTNRYTFQKGSGGSDEPVKVQIECQCVEHPDIKPPVIPPLDCSAAEWTGIAPMGRLIEPRIIPAKFSPQQIEGMATGGADDCFKVQPNRFLKILRTAYPDLYERLKQMPKQELNRRMERQRLFTTYQIDYCHMNEYPEGIYESLKQQDEKSRINASKLLQQQEPCSEFRTNIMQELEHDQAAASGGGDNAESGQGEKGYKPFKITFADSSRFVASGDNSHWRAPVFAKRADITEYMDTISRNGCVIVKNNLHDHSKCTKTSCRHQLAFTCPDMK